MFNNEGFLKNINDWTEDLAKKLALEEKIELTSEHFDILYYLRNYYFEHQSTPSMRNLIQHLKQSWPEEKAKSAYINHLFPLVFFLQASKIAGLPKPNRCI